MMRTIPTDSFPPTGYHIVEETDRRVVLLHVTDSNVDISVWLRHIESLDPTVLGGWYCSPDSGISLELQSASVLRSLLEFWL